jgi:hypothetical protein
MKDQNKNSTGTRKGFRLFSAMVFFFLCTYISIRRSPEVKQGSTQPLQRISSVSGERIPSQGHMTFDVAQNALSSVASQPASIEREDEQSEPVAGEDLSTYLFNMRPEQYSFPVFRDGVEKRINLGQSFASFVVDEHNKLDMEDIDTMSRDVDWILSLRNVSNQEKVRVIEDFIWSQAVLYPDTHNPAIVEKVMQYYSEIAELTHDHETIASVETYLASKGILN